MEVVITISIVAIVLHIVLSITIPIALNCYRRKMFWKTLEEDVKRDKERGML